MADANALYHEFLRRRAAGENVDLETICVSHPELALSLRALHSLELEEDGQAAATVDECATRDADAGEAVAGLGARVAALGGGPTDGLRAGDEVGPYRLIEKIGEGGFATVFRAEQLAPVRRMVALKSIKPELVSRNVLARFAAERQALAMMSHTSIARVYDAGTTERGGPWVVMEFVDGVPITEHADREALDVAARLRLLLQVIDAVGHAHQKAVVHRDIKPSNVLVASDGNHATAKVIDFGIAKAISKPLTDDTLVTGVGQVVGTPEYMSPEQVEASEGGVDTRTDIYALGVILFELLVGVRPFDSEELRRGGVSELLRRLAEDDRPRASQRFARLEPDLAEQIARQRSVDSRALLRVLRADLDWIVARALERDPARRYATAPDFAEDIKRYLRHEPVHAGPPSFSYRLRKLVQRRRLPILAGLAMLATALVVGLAVRARLSSLEFERRTTQSRALLERGEKGAESVRSQNAAYAIARRRLDAERGARESWAPIWERSEELRLHADLVALQGEVRQQLGSAFVDLRSALEYAPPGSDEAAEARGALERLYFRSRAGIEVPLREILFREVFGQDNAKPRLGPGHQRLRLRSTPGGASVQLYRYVLVEERLVPLPVDPAHLVRGEVAVAGEPSLRVEAVLDESLAAARAADGARFVFRENDIWRTLNATALRTRGDLARAVASSGWDDVHRLEVERDGTLLAVDWRPEWESQLRARWPAPGANADADADADAETLAPTGPRLVSIAEQIGLTFAGYPLDPEGPPLGRTGGVEPLELELPPGSYLLVVAHEGYVPTRLPLVIPAENPIDEHVELVREVPDGFVHVPAGWSRLGGDEESYQPLDESAERIDGFFMARCEITFAEYCAFLNSVETRDRAVFDEDSPDELIVVSDEGERVRLLPWLNSTNNSRHFVVRDEAGAWTPDDAVQDLRWPVLGVSYHAAVEYARWRTRTDPDGWLYRLPSDEEWERAARGADGRAFVWGHYPVASFAWCLDGNPRRLRLPGPVGVTPTDESVFGIRDLAGSAEELTSGTTIPEHRPRRGSSWDQSDAQFLRAASRNGLFHRTRTRQVGIRLVAELARRARGT